jgi:chromatin structure-remodeling complex protein RSC7
MMHYPAIMQPTHARWEVVTDTEPNPDEETNGSLCETSTTARSHHEEEDLPEADAPSADAPPADAPPATIFRPIRPVYSRNFLIVDTLYENPSHSNLGIPGPQSFSDDVGFPGLSEISDEIKDLLPPECRREFDRALSSELEWKAKWSTEANDSLRRAPVIDKGLIL